MKTFADGEWLSFPFSTFKAVIIRLFSLDDVSIPPIQRPRNHFFRNLLLKKGKCVSDHTWPKLLRKGRKEVEGELSSWVLSLTGHEPTNPGCSAPIIPSSPPRSGPQRTQEGGGEQGRGSQKWWRLFSALRSSTDCQMWSNCEQQKADRWINRASEGYSLVKGKQEPNM